MCENTHVLHTIHHSNPWHNALYTNQTLHHLFNTIPRKLFYAQMSSAKQRCKATYLLRGDLTENMPYILAKKVRDNHYPFVGPDLRVVLFSLQDLIIISVFSPFFPSLRYALEEHEYNNQDQSITVQLFFNVLRRVCVMFKDTLHRLSLHINNTLIKHDITSALSIILTVHEIDELERQWSSDTEKTLIALINALTLRSPLNTLEEKTYLAQVLSDEFIDVHDFIKSYETLTWSIDAQILEQILNPESPQHIIIAAGTGHGENIRAILLHEQYQLLYDTQLRDINNNTYSTYKEFWQARNYSMPFPSLIEQIQTTHRELTPLTTHDFELAEHILLSLLTASTNNELYNASSI